MKKSSKQIQREVVLLLISQLEAGEISIDRVKKISKLILSIIPDEMSDQDELPANTINKLSRIPEINRIFLSKND